ncbi:hypothetical protein TrVE_jg7659 [Triparma verrucosa]|uniref:Uncharacterized protein n=1 Tax=Triparma verrucosa TaxID=1606542 RepID=A0A9W7BTX6_9STRA|nr:hypothetical protein TrVE_jg7659 [Triparma verrucosa]
MSSYPRLILLILVSFLIIDSETFTPNTPIQSIREKKLKSTTNHNPNTSNNERGLQTRLENLYQSSLSIKCPFFRRRTADLLDSTTLTLNFLASRHRSIFPSFLYLTPPGSFLTSSKTPNLPLSTLKTVLLEDWSNNYYITGSLTCKIYNDDTLFTSPDPDMPVSGLRKYISASSNLFLPGSRCELKSLEVVGEVIKAEWRLEGRLKLPWRPKVWSYEGCTTYIFDEEGLVKEHREEWNVGWVEVFLRTLAPDVAGIIYDL